jgi:hypothetical protein
MEQLKDVNNNLNEVRNTIYSIQEEYNKISHLENTLGELRREANKHKQLKSAKENVKNILNVEDLAKQARQYIDANKILNAHKCLLDMEKCRNDILEELGSSNEKNVNVSDIKVKKNTIDYKRVRLFYHFFVIKMLKLPGPEFKRFLH